MKNLTLLAILGTLGVLSALLFTGFLFFLIIKRKDPLNKIVLNYIAIGIVSCVLYGLTHNLLVNPGIFNSVLAFDFSYPQIQAYFICWSYRAMIYFLIFSVWLRVMLKRALRWTDKTRIFRMLFLHAVLISTAWITDFEKLLYYGGSLDLHHFLHWLGGIIGCTMVLLLEYVFMERQIITYLNVTGRFQSIRAKLLSLFLGITVIMLLAIIGILAGCLGSDAPGVLIAKVVIYACFFLIPLVYIILAITGDFHKNLGMAMHFLEQAGRLDFTYPVVITSSDEFGQLGQSLLTLKENLRALLITVKHSATDVDASADKIDSTLASLVKQSESFFSVLNRGMEERAGTSAITLQSLQEITARVETISTHVTRQSSSAEDNLGLLDAMRNSLAGVNTQAQEATTIARRLFAIAEEGKGLIQQTLDGVLVISALSDKISEVIGVIDNITEETKILAINAQIESARAGVTGRGFAVVAGQMRLLAGTTGRNAQSISVHVKDIYRRVKNSLVDMEKSKEGYLHVHEQVAQSRDISQVISAAMDNNTRLLSEVFTASRKLTEISHEVVQFSGQLKTASQAIRTAFEAMKQAAMEETRSTQENAQFMQQVIETMRLVIRDNTGIAEKLKSQVARVRIE